MPFNYFFFFQIKNWGSNAMRFTAETSLTSLHFDQDDLKGQ